MKIECSKEKLEKAVQLADRATSKSPTLPILAYVLLEAGRNSLTLHATNLDVGIEINIPAKVDKPGLAAIRGATLMGFLANSAKDKNVILESVDSGLAAKVSGGDALLKTIGHEDFPKVTKMDGSSGIVISADLLSSGIKSVSYSASVSHIKPELASVVIYGDGKSLVFVSTDSFRLAEKKVKADLHKELARTIIPIKNAVELGRIAEEMSGTNVNLFVGKNQVALEGSGVYFASRVVDGTFPDYKQVIPKDSKTEVVMLKEDFARAVKASTVFSDSFNQTTVSVSPAKKQIEFKSKNADIGEADLALKGAVSGEAMEISFNHRYLSDCLQSIASDSVSISFSGANSATLIRGVSDNTFLYIVMPMNR